MSKGLEALERLSAVASMYCDECATDEKDLDRGMFEKDYKAVKTIEKELKALETLKDLIGVIEIEQYNKKPNRYELRMCGKVYYINENEYQALKEVLL